MTKLPLVGVESLLLLEPYKSSLFSIALDARSESKMLEAINNYASTRQGGVTRIIIAHRFSAIDSVDAILVLKNGLVEEYGTCQVW